MYSIEYYKNKKKPVLEEPELSGDIEVDSYMRRRYHHQKDLVNKCWDIKSLTIDLEDIMYVVKDMRLRHLFGLYARVCRADLEDGVDSITILNNNNLNLSLIYEIINCDWMVNKDTEINNIDIVKRLSRLNELKQAYESTRDSDTKKWIRTKMSLIEYYIDTIIKKYEGDTSEKGNSVRLGRTFIKDRKETN